MPKRNDIKHVMVIGSGPIMIGQACEFDYSGTQACRVLKQEGIQVTLINSNPATIMTDPEIADNTYIEPITVEFIEKIIVSELEKNNEIDSILPTLGGQTALNVAIDLAQTGLLEKYNIKLIGADVAAIERGENRQNFKNIVEAVGAETPRSKICFSLAEAKTTALELNYPVVVRPSFTMGGLGSGMAYDESDLIRIVKSGLEASPSANVLIEESILGWKEYELELMRDHKDNVVVVCSIENFDPVGVHTGDSITVAPAMTLTDKEYQQLRDIAIKIIRKVGVATGGCNIQFAVNPDNGRIIVIEMNPRVSRSSALASKATGFPIAKIATKLALGYGLDEVSNDITKVTPACFEPTLDYVVVKIPRFAFEKFPSADNTLTTTMKSVGEVMAFGGSFIEALNKALNSLETNFLGFWTQSDLQIVGSDNITVDRVLELVKIPTQNWLYQIELALRLGVEVAQLHELTQIDSWFLAEISRLVDFRNKFIQAPEITSELLREAKSLGLSDNQLINLRQDVLDDDKLRKLKQKFNIIPNYKTVDTCAAEFPAYTPYYYGTYQVSEDFETEIVASAPDKLKIIILGSGPNRIGQGIEFDYSCVHAVQSLATVGYETIMVNCNPETVSTDYDTADRLYFEPLTLESVLNIVAAESNSGKLVGVIVTLGGQTPLNLAADLAAAGVNIIGTAPAAIALAEDRAKFEQVLEQTNLVSPPFGMAHSLTEALEIANKVGYPVLLRPSFVLGGRGMEIVYHDAALIKYVNNATELTPKSPILVDRFLEDAIEIDVDALFDGKEMHLGAIMEHIEEAGVHSGDSACILPPITIGVAERKKIISATLALAKNIGVKGLINVQYALKDGVLYVLEANPRASRTLPFIAKATGVPLIKAAARIMLGTSIASLRLENFLPQQPYPENININAPIAVKEAVLPFHRFKLKDGGGVDPLLGPEMKSTGEVMGISSKFSLAFAKSQIAAFGKLPTEGRVFVSVSDKDKRHLIYPVKRLLDLGFSVLATSGTAEIFNLNGIPCEVVRKFSEPYSDKFKTTNSIVDMIKAKAVDLVINTPVGNQTPRIDGYEIRAAALAAGVPCATTVQGAAALIQAIEAYKFEQFTVMSLQDLHQKIIN